MSSRLRRGGALAAVIAAALAGPASAATGDASALAGTWTGPSYDTTYDLPGELTANFEVRSASTFAGVVDAVYPTESLSEHCTIQSGTVSDSGAVRMVVLCRAEGYPMPEPALITGQLDGTGTTLTGTFSGPAGDEGTFSLTKAAP
jgi:hypothetical protein